MCAMKIVFCDITPCGPANQHLSEHHASIFSADEYTVWENKTRPVIQGMRATDAGLRPFSFTRLSLYPIEAADSSEMLEETYPDYTTSYPTR
jgi:hypothetical protein